MRRKLAPRRQYSCKTIMRMLQTAACHGVFDSPLSAVVPKSTAHFSARIQSAEARSTPQDR
jgi:hypothetical protein